MIVGPNLDLNGKRLLFIKPSSLGDVCHAVASAWALKARWPGLHVTWLVNRTFEPLLKGVACVDETLSFDRARFKGLLSLFRERSALRAFVQSLRQGCFDVALDLQGLLRSGMFAWLSNAPVRLGFAKAREGSRLFYTHPVDTPAGPIHARDRYDALTAALGCAKPPREDLDVGPAERSRLHELLSREGFSGERMVAVCPGARWESKRWPPLQFARVLDELAGHGAGQPLIVGSPDMAEICREVAAACKLARPVDLCGRTGLRELTALLDECELLLTCDSGPMHIAAAQGTPVVAVLGPTDPLRTGPYGQLDHVVSGECELMPCLKRHCPGLGDKCMKDLDARRVIEKALALLNAGRRK